MKIPVDNPEVLLAKLESILIELYLGDLYEFPDASYFELCRLLKGELERELPDSLIESAKAAAKTEYEHQTFSLDEED